MRGAVDDPDVRTVEAGISYVTADSRINRRFVAPGVECNTGRYQTHRVRIRDGRPIRERFSLDVNGFVLTEHRSAVRDFFDRDEVERIYPGEVEETVKALTGANRVALMSWMIRTSGDLSRHIARPSVTRTKAASSRRLARRTSTSRHDARSSLRVISTIRPFRTAMATRASSPPAFGAHSRNRRRTGRSRCATRGASAPTKGFRTRCTSWTAFPNRKP